jgi:adsorption protein B
VDAFVIAVLGPLAVWIVIGGIDDLIVDVTGFWAAWQWKRQPARPSRRVLLSTQQKAIAVMVPLWHEHSVIGRMVRQNSASILYGNYHFFIGGYPNDTPTLDEIRKLEDRYPHVHMALCPHDGPTSKADCLNWIYQNIVAYEGRHGIRFQVLVTHDAEDVIHSDALHWINYYADRDQMVQVPVLPLATRVREWTHGLYIDEFTEYQTRDMPARQAMGAFVPSNGVGTGFRRDAMETLAQCGQNRIFEPVCLTEDYENGYRLKLRGATQIFLPLLADGMATREYFPHTLRSAIRQRTRWVTGIALQTWDRHGWSGSLVQKYWLWRDRKGLLGNPASLLTNLLFIYGGLRALMGEPLPSAAPMTVCMLIGVYRLAYRMACVWRIYGFGLAATVPARVLIGNYINTVATFSALRRFWTAKLMGAPLVWLKTEHAYPTQAALGQRSARIGEVLVANGYASQAQVNQALSTKPDHMRLGEHLVDAQVLDENDLYDALRLQHSLPQSSIDAADVPPWVARALPAAVASRHKLVPFKVEVGRLFVAGPELPNAEVRREVERYTSLELEFHLVTPSSYRRLTEELLTA